jgi:hypothetical protein
MVGEIQVLIRIGFVAQNLFTAINHYLKLHLVVKAQWAGSMAINYML